MIQPFTHAEDKPSSSKKTVGTDYELYETGGADISPTTTPGLVLMGGGGDVDEAMRWFIAKAGGGDIVILRAAGSDGYHDYFYDKLGGINSIASIVFKSAKPSSDPVILDRIAKAEGIFIAGGDQSKYFEYWANTPVAAAVTKHFKDGKPLGGTSAGLAVLGGWSFSARNDSVISKEALADPFDRRVTLEKGMFDIPLIAGFITDTHFTARERLGRLITFVARLRTQKDPVSLIGIGVDERTTLCIDGDGTATVISADKGNVTLVKLLEEPKKVEAGHPLEVDQVAIKFLTPGSTFPISEIDTQFKDVKPVSIKDGIVPKSE